MGCANSKDSGVALRAGLVGCARTGCAVSPLTGSIPDARKPRANAPLRVERDGGGSAGCHGKTRGMKSTRPHVVRWCDGNEQRESSLVRARRPARHLWAPMPKAHGEGQLEGSLRPSFTAFAVYASRWVVARPRLSSAVEAVRATPRPSQGLSGTGAAHVPLNGLIWPKDGCASIASAATASGRLSSPGMATPRRRRRGDPDPPIPREARKPPGHHPPLRCGPTAASPIASGLLIAIEAAVGAAR